MPEVVVVLYDERGNYLVGGQLPLATRKGRQIPNDRRGEQPPVRLQAAKEMFETSHDTVKARSLTGVYNCMGLVFGSRRTWIDPDDIGLILEDDDYHQVQLSELVVGDIVVYKSANKAVTHVGWVVEKRANLSDGTFDVMVLSQWGQDGEYYHRADDVNERLGAPAEYWSDRK